LSQQQQQQQQLPTASSSGSGSRFAERSAAIWPYRLDLQLLQEKGDEASGSSSSSSYVRGTTVCLAALGKSKTTTNDSGEVCGVQMCHAWA
jgi:hypothetical protein